jgi:hypothetical protein
MVLIVVVLLGVVLALGVTVIALALVRGRGRGKRAAAKTVLAALPASSPSNGALLNQVDELLADGKISPADHDLARSRILNAEPPAPR